MNHIQTILQILFIKHFTILVAIALVLIGSMTVSAQETFQTVRGRVLDQSGSPIEGARIKLISKENHTYVTADSAGRYTLQIPPGRRLIQAEALGYIPQEIPLLVSVGREQEVDFKLQPSAYALGGLEVVSNYDKTKALQPLAYSGARSFSTEEAERYAGSLQDPARMVRNFAGVMPINDTRNEIVVRGNTPLGVQYRLDGIEVPNPNHFNAGSGMTAGQVTILNMNMITNSDFFSGGWQAPYGNALSGIFDLHLRKGNSHSHQMIFQMGYNGLELTAEGPMSRSGKSTYLTSYRYSIPDVMSKLGAKGVLPFYHDLSAKLDFDLGEKHSLSLVTILGSSSIDFDTAETGGAFGEQERNKDVGLTFKVDLHSSLALAGLVHRFRINDATRLKSTLSWNYSKVSLSTDTADLKRGTPYVTLFKDNTKDHKLTFTSEMEHQLQGYHKLFAGVILDQYFIRSYNEVGDYAYPLNDMNEQMQLLRGYAQYKHHFNAHTDGTIGLHAMWLPLNHSVSIEPRAGLRVRLHPQHTLGVSGGLYSQMPPRTLFFVRQKVSDEKFINSNSKLSFAKSMHANLSYDYQPSRDWHFKLESYYQYLYDIPAEQKEYGSNMLNWGQGENYIERIQGLKNNGKGRNYGVELTVEKFFTHNYYFLLTGSMYRSLYTDPILNQEFSTVFDGKYMLNLSGGGEWDLSRKWTLFASPRLSFAGGLLTTPVLEKESIQKQKIIVDKTRWHEEKLPSYFRLDLRIGARLNSKKSSQEWGLDLVNITNHKNVFNKGFDVHSGKSLVSNQLGFFPMITYRFNFKVPTLTH